MGEDGKMELLQLQYFVEIAKLESVTNTAKKLRVSQPSLSQTMRRLEKELGTKLFKKEGHRLKLTPQGREFYARVAPALQALADAAGDLREDRVRGSITIGSYLSLAPIMPALGEFAREYPDITFTFLRINSLDYVDRKNLDALFCYDQSDRLNFREWIYIASFERKMILPRDHLLPPRGEYLQLQDLKQDDFVSLQWDNGRVEEIFDEFAYKNMVPNVRYRTNSALFKQEIMEAGLAVGFANAMIAGQLHDTGQYRVVPHSPDVVPVKTYLAWRDTSVLSPAACELKRFVQKKFTRRRLLD